MKPITGMLIFAGDLSVNGEPITGVALECERENLMRELPLYQACVVMTLEEYNKLTANQKP